MTDGRAARTIALALVSAAVTGCAGQGDAGRTGCGTARATNTRSTTTMPGVAYERARDVLRARYQDIRQRYDGVQGAGVASVADEGHRGLIYGIRVTLREDAALPRGPQSIDGVPMIFVAGGAYHAQSC